MPTEQEHAALVLGPEDEGKFVSAADFAQAEFVAPWKYEREEGRLVVMPPDGYEHQTTAEPWRNVLGAYALLHPEIVRHVFSAPWVRDEDEYDFIGDIGVYLVTIDPAPPIPERAPDIMFEIVSPGRVSRERDYVKKRERYHAIGIREYVIVNRFAKTVLVLTRRDDRYAERLLTEDDVYSSPLLPGFELALHDLF